MPRPKDIAEPHKEIRFTRGRQALVFTALGVALLCAALGLWIKAAPILGNAAGEAPAVPSYGWGFVPLLPSIWAFWAAAHCARHAYLILTPLGVEVFPFWFPSKNMDILYWSELSGAELDEMQTRLTLHRSGGGGAVISLAPIPRAQRPLLAKAVEGRAGELG